MAGAVAAIVWAIVPGQETIAPFAYHREREGEFQRAGAAGEAHLVYANSPGGAVATARRVARLGPGIDAAARAGGVAPEVVEGMVFLESGGLPDVIAGGDPKGAAGVAQILPETARGLLGLRVDLTASRRLTRQIAAARRRHDAAAVARLSRQRRRVDQRFDPARSLTATGRYLALAGPKFAGRPDFAVVSYHMGIENLADAVRAYAGPKEKRLAVHVIREREGEFQRAGAAGEAHLVYANSPGGAVATARRVAGLGPGIDAAARAGGVASEVVEGMVFLESGGLPDVIAGGDPKGAAGVAQILPETARGLLGLRVDLTASRRLTRQIAAARRRHDAAA
ncbi:MAG: hypothetical protein ACJ8H8_21285, partial [Geminicoccaceae bacterium]